MGVGSLTYGARHHDVVYAHINWHVRLCEA